MEQDIAALTKRGWTIEFYTFGYELSIRAHYKNNTRKEVLVRGHVDRIGEVFSTLKQKVGM